MYKLRTCSTSVLLLLVLVLAPSVFAQYGEPSSGSPSDQELKELAPKVFLDCHGCDRDYIRDNITYVNFVRDRKDADIHILVTQQSTGSGGQEYTFTFIGLKDFEGKEHTLVHASSPNDTRDETRRSQVEVLERGIFPFVLETPICEHITLDFQRRLEPTAVKDPWKFWVFSIDLDGSLRGESTRSSRSLDMNLSANKVTPEFKIRLGLSAEFDERTYEYEEETIISKSDEKNLSGMAVKSLGEHWSVGGWIEAESSSYSNLDLLLTVAPAIEFSVFPYSQSTRKQLRFLYRIGYNYANYTEETIFNKMTDSLYNQSLTLLLEFRQPWGNASTSIEGSHYFHDLKKNRLELNGFVNIRLIKGLSLTLRGSYER
ncbi:MAG: hypothetical protein PVI11_06090, partial [Candidatus Aminicenantes bacterium]